MTMTAEATAPVQTHEVGDVVDYQGRTFHVYRVTPTQWGFIYDLKAPYKVRTGPARFGTRYTYASTFNRRGELS